MTDRLFPTSALARTGAADEAGYCRTFSTDWWLICATLFSTLMIARFGTLAVVICVLLYAIVIVRNVRLTWGTLLYYSALLSLPFLAILSTFWSDAPGITSKQSVELLATFAFGLVVVRRLSARGFASAVMLAAILPCAVSLAIQPSAFHGVSLYGIFGSKNFLSFTAQLLLACGLAVAVDATQPITLRFISLGAMALGIVDVALAHSSGGLLTAVVSSAGFIALILFPRFPFGWRVLVVVTLCLLLPALSLTWNDVVTAAQDFQTNVLHKDVTLTGRTGLWIFSQSLIAEKPMLGHGYSAFWRQGNLDAEALWRSMGIVSRTGFNFHNQFIETEVNFGYVGLALLVILLVSIGLLSILRVIRHPSPSSALMTSLVIALYSRLPVEATLIGPWNIFTLIWVAIAVHSVSPLEVHEARTGFMPKEPRRFPFRGRADALVPSSGNLD